jgi:regulator of replication initiation timing
MKESNNRSGKLYLYIIIILLLTLNGIFIYNYFTTDKKLVVTEEQLYATDSAKAELEKVLVQTETELEQFKGKNAQLDAFLKEKNDSIQEYAERIEVLLKQGRLSKDKLNEALDEIDQLRYYKRKYLNQIDSLSNHITKLNRENSNLKQTIDQEKRKNEDLVMENIKLGNKVAIGAKLQTTEIFATGIKIRSNGKERETSKASQVEQIKITFKVAENYVAEKGNKDIYLKIVGPDGTTIYNEAAGSGTFTFQGQESLYSTKKTIDFTQDAQQVSIYWSKGSNSEYAKGKYLAELYADGFKIGSSEFELK